LVVAAHRHAEPKSEVQQFREKQARYRVHRESVMDPTDFERTVEVVPAGLASLLDFRASLGASVGGGAIASTQPGARLQAAVVAAPPPATRRWKTLSAPELTY
jgi:hypothetical protein